MRYAVRLPAEFQPEAPVVVDLSNHRPSQLAFRLSDSSAALVAECIFPPHAVLGSVSAAGHDLIVSSERAVPGGWEVDGGFGRMLLAVSATAPGEPLPLSRWHLRHIEETTMAGVAYRARPLPEVVADCEFSVVGGSVQVLHRVQNDGKSRVCVTLATSLAVGSTAAGIGSNDLRLEWQVDDGAMTVELARTPGIAVRADPAEPASCLGFRYPAEGCVELAPGMIAEVRYELRARRR